MGGQDAAPIEPALLERVLQPLERARTLPGEAYASPEVLAWERRHFLEGSWVCVGRATDLERPGDQRALRIGSVSILLVRGETGSLRGFFNVCRHRGHELLEPGTARNARGIKCPYHAWVYGLEWDPAILREVLGHIIGRQAFLRPAVVRTFVFVVAASLLCLLFAYPVAYFVARYGGRRTGMFLTC